MAGGWGRLSGCGPDFIPPSAVRQGITLAVGAQSTVDFRRQQLPRAASDRGINRYVRRPECNSEEELDADVTGDGRPTSAKRRFYWSV